MNMFLQGLNDIFRLKFENLLGWASFGGMLVIESIPTFLAVIAPAAMLGVSVYIRLDAHRREQNRKQEEHDLKIKIEKAKHLDELNEFDNNQK